MLKRGSVTGTVTDAATASARNADTSIRSDLQISKSCRGILIRTLC